MKIYTADERLNEPRGAKLVIAGPTGVGKTSLVRTIDDPSRVLFLDSEAGDLSIRDVPVDTIHIDDWRIARDVGVRIGGPNPSFASTSCYSEAHFKAVGGWLENLDRYDLIFVDSITHTSRLCFRWSEQQPEARSDRTGAKDLRGAYSRRKFFENQIIDGIKQGHRDMAQHWYGVRKKILESARNIKKDDKSPQALAAYRADLKDFDGLTFVAKIGIEKGKPRKEGGNYDDKNIIAAVITPGQDEYHPIVQAPPFNGGGAGGDASSPAPSGSSSSPANSPIEPPPWAR